MEEHGNPKHRADRRPSKICPVPPVNPGSPGSPVRVPLFCVCHWSQGGESLVRGGWTHISQESRWRQRERVHMDTQDSSLHRTFLSAMGRTRSLAPWAFPSHHFLFQSLTEIGFCLSEVAPGHWRERHSHTLMVLKDRTDPGSPCQDTWASMDLAS